MSSNQYGCFWGTELFNYKDIKKPVIKHILYENDVICISSKPGVGKSILAKQLLFNLTTGTPFLDTYEIPKSNNVLYIQTEGDRAETIERINCMKLGLNIDNNKWVHINQCGLTINTNKGIEQLMNLAKKPQMDYDVILIDPLYTTVKGTLNNDEVATDWVRNIRMLTGEFGATLVIFHHDAKDLYQEGKAVNKGDSNIFGSIYWSAFFTANFKLKKLRDIHYLTTGKQRSGKIIDNIAMKLIEPRPLMYVNDDSDLDLSQIKVQKVLMSENVRMNAREIQKKIQMSLATTYRALGKLKDLDLIDSDEENKFSWKQKSNEK